MVNFLTCVSFAMLDLHVINPGNIDANQIREASEKIAQRTTRIAAMLDCLSAHEFTFIYKNNEICAYSKTVEAQQVKEILLQNGFQDIEFQVHLEYSRRWGIL